MINQILALDSDKKVGEVILGFLLSICPYENTLVSKCNYANLWLKLSISSWLISKLTRISGINHTWCTYFYITMPKNFRILELTEWINSII